MVTSIEFERMISGTGATQGRWIRPSDGKEIRNIAWLQCVGSREPQANADYCSSICCMFAIKEALLAKEKSNGAVETAIFYMDMRTFGKDFQRYRDSAEKDKGVRFVRNRIHSIETGKAAGDLKIGFSDPAGNRHEEDFDLVVLATGQRPPAGTQDLAEKTGMELNPWGFCKLQDFSLSRTNKEGLFVGGSFSGLRDISESVIQASSASLEASRLIHSKGGGLFAVKPGAEKAFRDVSREPPHVAVALCSCGDSALEGVDLEGLSAWVKGRIRDPGAQGPASLHPGRMGRTPERHENAAAPIVYWFLRACRISTAPGSKSWAQRSAFIPGSWRSWTHALLLFPVADADRVRSDQDIRMALSMGLSRLKTMDPAPTRTRRITQRALVVGGGIAGMTAALAIADHGFHVDLVEKGQELGGNLRETLSNHRRHRPSGSAPEDRVTGRKTPAYRSDKGAAVKASHGHAGRFFTVIEKADGKLETLEHGITILATGGKEASD